MMKKILILCGSPRKGGNSDILCNQFAKGAQAAGHGFGLVIGTSAEGWLYDTVAFWEKQMKE